MENQLKTFVYKDALHNDKPLDYGFYRGSVVFNLNSIGDFLGLTKPQMSINTNDNNLVLKLTNEMFESSRDDELSSESNERSTYFRTLNNAGELFLTEAGLEQFLMSSRKEGASELLEWIRSQLPLIKEQIAPVKMLQIIDKTVVVVNNTPVTFIEENKHVMVSSRDVAEAFGKRHDNVMKVINGLPEDEFRQLHFELATYIDAQGKPRNHYLMTKDGFIYIIMRLTGDEAHKWRVAFINTFNKIERMLKSQAIATYGPTPESLKLQVALEEAKTRQEELKAVTVLYETKAREKEAKADIENAKAMQEEAKARSSIEDGRIKLEEIKLKQLELRLQKGAPATRREVEAIYENIEALKHRVEDLTKTIESLRVIIQGESNGSNLRR